MPRTLQEIKQFVPKSSLNNIQPDPAKNSVMGNIKLLHDALAELPNDNIADGARLKLEGILEGFNGNRTEEATDFYIKNLETDLQGVNTVKCGNGLFSLQDEKKKKEIKTLIEYVAGGLGLAPIGVTISEEQKKSIADMEKSGATAVAAEQKQARKEALESKSGLEVLDEHKAAIKAMPKKFKGPNADIDEAVASQKLRGLCIDIMATRRSIEAKRNNKSGLAASRMDAGMLDNIREDMTKSTALDQFLKSMSYSDLRSLAASGHGGAMEDKFAEYLKKTPEAIPADAPYQYMPTAKERTEAVKAMMDDANFTRQATPGEQRKLYIELLAARMAVNSKRHNKDSLNVQLNAETLDQERKKLKEEPLNTALIRLTDMGDIGDGTYKAAMSGHGGALEDRMVRMLRQMAMEKENNYQMQNVDPRFAPTYEERAKDLDTLLNHGKLTVKEQFRAVVERGIVAQASEQIHRKPDDRLSNIESINRQTDLQMGIYSKLMDERSMKDFVEDARANGYEAACYNFEAANAGMLKANTLTEKLDEQLEANPEPDALKKIAAQRMVLLQKKAAFQEDKNSDKLANALDKANLDKDVEKLMKDHLFKEVCDKLGTNGLMAQAKGDGAKLVESYALAKQDKLEPYNPVAPAPVN
ncbi:MAG: hypothetical protein IKG76_07585, partial [Firmicutes bacterium]|nr:hypothetical protein [Bacillota bacterium]